MRCDEMGQNLWIYISSTFFLRLRGSGNNSETSWIPDGDFPRIWTFQPCFGPAPNLKTVEVSGSLCNVLFLLSSWCNDARLLTTATKTYQNMSLNVEEYRIKKKWEITNKRTEHRRTYNSQREQKEEPKFSRLIFLCMRAVWSLSTCYF